MLFTLYIFLKTKCILQKKRALIYKKKRVQLTSIECCAAAAVTCVRCVRVSSHQQCIDANSGVYDQAFKYYMIQFKHEDPKRSILNWRFLSAIANSKFMHATVSPVLGSDIQRFVKDVIRHHFRLNQKFNVRGFGDTGMK